LWLLSPRDVATWLDADRSQYAIENELNPRSSNFERSFNISKLELSNSEGPEIAFTRHNTNQLIVAHHLTQQMD